MSNIVTLNKNSAKIKIEYLPNRVEEENRKVEFEEMLNNRIDGVFRGLYFFFCDTTHCNIHIYESNV
jgi:hypothetical protein